MARYTSRQRDLIRRWIYIISAVLIIVVVIVFIYRSSGENKDKTSMASTGINVGNEEISPAPVLLEVAPLPTADSNSMVSELIEEAMALIESRPAKIIAARDRLNEALAIPQSRRQRAFVKNKLSELADKWLFSRTVFPQDNLCGSLQVKPGDQLRTIGVQYKVPYEILLDINKISSPQSLQAGGVIKVINGPFHARIYRSTFTMDLYLQNTFVRSFSVGLGKPGRETPTGLWIVEPGGKLISPTWRDPDTGRTYEAEDPDYPLGSRWIRLKGLKGDAVGRTGIAFHGTKDPDLIGSAGSRGCIRLHNGDVVLIYNLFMPGFSRVEVVE